MKFFTINGNRYEAKEFDFNMVCDFAVWGIQPQDLGKNLLVSARAYLASCAGLPLEVAGNELQSHIIHGGDATELINCMMTAASDSLFFQAMQKRAETDNGESEAESEEPAKKPRVVKK